MCSPVTDLPQTGTERCSTETGRPPPPPKPCHNTSISVVFTRSNITMPRLSLIRSILEYNSFVYTFLARSNQERIEVIQNTALRTITAALRTTPTCALLAMRSQAALLKYFLKCKTFSNHPALHCFRKDSEDINPGAFRHSPPVGVQLWPLSDRYGINVQVSRISVVGLSYLAKFSSSVAVSR